MPPSPTTIVDSIPELEPELPAELFATSTVWWWVGVAVLVLALGLLWFILRRRRKKREVAPIPPAQQALEALEQLEKSRPALLREFCLQLSLILRRYLQGELHDPALYETHEEFSRRIDSLSAVPEQLRLPVQDLLEQLAEYKYAASDTQAPTEADALCARARELLIRIRDFTDAQPAAQPTAQAAESHCMLPLFAAGAATRELVWGSPGWLWLLLLIVPLFLLRKRRGADGAICLPTLSLVRHLLRPPHSLAGWLGPICYTLAVACMIIALAQPRWRHEHDEQKVSGIDIMIACDLSGSMGLRDMVFTVRGDEGDVQRGLVARLTAAKYEITKFIEERPNDRIGLLAFAGRAKLCSPLTLDHQILRYIMDQFYLTDERGEHPGYIQPDGTAIGTAIAGAATRLHERPDTKSRVIILVTDGANNSGSLSPIDAAKESAKLGIKIFTIAIGKEDRLSRYTADVDTFDEKTLREIADITGGRFYRAGSGAQLQDAFRSIDSLEKTDATRRRLVSYEALFTYPLLLAAILLVLGYASTNLRTRFAP